MRRDEMAERVKAIRLPINELAARAGVNKHTAYHVVNGKPNMMVSTLEGLQNALVEEELRLLDHLQALHPGKGTGQQ